MFDDALDSVRNGEVVGLPTDTVYGLAIDPLNRDAVSALYDLKGRPDSKPLGILLASVDDAEMFGDLDGVAGYLARRFWPGALTLVVTPRVILSDWVGDTQLRTIGIRVPGHDVARDFLTVAGPLAVTSANLSGQPEVMDDVEARSIFGNRVSAYIPGRAPGGMASTVVDATGARPIVIREGAVDIFS
jgi:tRNA threonylcarbamoyl adenosine modification protein (Sua5/YciO/YrdC/YwlC family)